MVEFVCCVSRHDSDNNVNDFAVEAGSYSLVVNFQVTRFITKISGK